MIYTSTSCLKNPKKVIKVLEEYEKAGIKNVELGSVHEYFDVSLLKKFDFNFIIHNYFPPPKESFNLNLASKNEVIRTKSVSLAKSAIDLCCRINSPLYTFHAGLTVDPPKLGEPLPRKKIVGRKEAFETYYESVTEILEYSKNRGIKIAMEPNVVQEFNLINGRNELCLFAEFSEIEDLFKKLQNKKLGLLVDLGHTLVTSYWLNFDKDRFVEKCKSKTYAVHVSNNNGIADQHKSLTETCWAVSKLKMFKDIPISLETMNLSIEQIKSNIKIVNDSIFG